MSACGNIRPPAAVSGAFFHNYNNLPGPTFMPRSMTGFARQESQHPWGSLSCEIRTVNHRYLEPTLRLSETLRALEPELRDRMRKQLSRGKVEVNLQLKTDAAAGTDLALNQAFAQHLISLAETVGTQLQQGSPINPLDILRWPGVLQTAEIDPQDVAAAAQSLFEETLAMLVANREREGAELKTFIAQRMQTIASHVGVVREKLPAIQKALRDKMRSRIEALAVDVDEERFNQEVVYLCQKSDVAEELDRLEAHIQETQHALEQNGPIGRRLDFLMQEFNREANTLSSKSTASDTTQIAVDLKVLIEQMREQVQNIE
ncbi:YicC/YloC family endoribonuclease [Teredinibacter turnerae]|uniref:YicC/YloC family endoribonuclease n=1 Tax=Teredinibacter turnerae TaxID=2426 RepID=UPI00048B0700|nr:YicC/YloC family endoribonuclease [Teredinibacter turnerae]